MSKSVATPICDASPGERILVGTRRGAQAYSHLVEDSTSKVVRTPDNQETYVLSKEKFEENYDTNPVDMPEDNSVNRWLATKGCSWHMPKVTSVKVVYQPTAEDLASVPFGMFYASWGGLQHIVEGDFLAMPIDNGRGKEVYV